MEECRYSILLHGCSTFDGYGIAHIRRRKPKEMSVFLFCFCLSNRASKNALQQLQGDDSDRDLRASGTLPRSSSREVRIRVPFFSAVYFSRGSPKQG